jgi:hypothetical protein
LQAVAVVVKILVAVQVRVDTKLLLAVHHYLCHLQLITQ